MKDNFNINGIEDYIVEDANVSEILRTNKIKVQRNAEAKAKMKYKNALEIIAVSLTVLVVIIGLVKANNYNAKELNKCMVNHTENYCMKGM